MHWHFGKPSVRIAVEAWLSGVAESSVVADGAERRLVRLPLASSPDLLVKLFRVDTARHPWRERIKRRLGASAAQREWRSLRGLHEAGLAVPEPLGRARLPSGDEVVVEEYVAGQNLHALLQQSGGARRALLVDLGNAVRRLHAAGFTHGDLHPGNIASGPHGPVLLDFQRARRFRIRSPRRSRDLGLLDYTLARLGVSRGDRLRLRKCALGLRETRTPKARRALRDVAEASRRAALRHQRNRTRRCTRAGQQQAAFRLEEGKGLRRPSLPEVELRALLAEHRAAVRAQDDRLLQSDERCRITSLQATVGRVVVKEVNQSDVRRRLADLLRGSPGRRAWRAGHGLAVRGIAAATPLAFLERRYLGLPQRSWSILESVGEISAADAEALSDLPPGSLSDALCGLLLRLHVAGVQHGDLKASNIRFARRGDRIEPCLVDLEGVRFPRRLSAKQRILELAQLNASLAEAVLPAGDREAALRRYSRRLPFGGGNAAARRRVIRLSLKRGHIWRGSDCPDASAE